MTQTSTEQPEALPTGRELAILLSQGHYSMCEAVAEIRRQWQEINDLQYRVKELEASQARVRGIAVSALLTASRDRQDWIDDMARIEGITQGKQG